MIFSSLAPTGAAVLLRAHPFAIAAGVCLVLLIVASCVVFKQRRPELFAKALGAAEEKLRTALVDAGRKEIDLATEGKDIAKRLAEANVVAVATDGLGGGAAVGTGADVLTKAPDGVNEMVVGAATDLLTKKDKEEEEDDKAASPTEDLEKDDEDDGEARAAADDDDEAKAAADQAAEDEAEEEERKTFWESVQTKFKILIAVYQIQNALPWTLPFVSYPDAFEALVSWMSFIELDFVRIIPVECMMPHNFFYKLFASTSIPLGLAGIILVCGKLASLARRDPTERREVWIYAYSWFLLLTYVVFTGVSTTVLRFFNCVEYDSVNADGSSKMLYVLQADHSISCESESYKEWKGYAWIMVFIYPVGIPSWYLLELLWWRKGINPIVDERRHNLTSKYQPVWKSSSELGSGYAIEPTRSRGHRRVVGRPNLISTQVPAGRGAGDAAGTRLLRVPLQGVGVDARPAPQGLRARRDRRPHGRRDPGAQAPGARRRPRHPAPVVPLRRVRAALLLICGV